MNPAMHTQYRNMSHPNAPSSTSRRGQNSMQHATAQREAQLKAEARERMEAEHRKKEQAQRRASKPVDKNMPEGIDELIVGDGVQQYKRMREIERRMDSVMMRKRFEMSDTRHNVSKRYKKMRIWISNTFEARSRQEEGMESELFDFSEANEGFYRMKIEGRLLDDDNDDDTASAEDDSDEEDTDNDEDTMDQDGEPAQNPVRLASQKPRTKFSHFFKVMTIDFDRSKNVSADFCTQIEWKKPNPSPNAVVLPPGADFDSLEIERRTDSPLNCTINLYRDEERYLLSEPLAELLDTKIEDRRSILIGLWDYIRHMQLQQDDEKRAIQCDDRLKKVFGRDVIFIPDIHQHLAPHLYPQPPISLPYTIHTDPSPTPKDPTIYDISLTITGSTLPLPLPSLQQLQQIANLDSHLALCIQAIQQSKSKHAFMNEFEKDPVGFLKRWMGSQRRDLEVIVGDGVGMGRGDWGQGDGYGVGMEWRRGGKDGVWGRDVVRESVGLMKGERV